MANPTILTDTAANWMASNPVLDLGQLGVESDVRNGTQTGTGYAKMGDGVSRWNDLGYFTPAVLPVSPYLVYSALLTQGSTEDPEATVLQNTLGGTVVWSYADVGKYNATLSGAFVSGKTAVLQPNNTTPIEAATTFAVIAAYRVDSNIVRVETARDDPLNATFGVEDGLLNATFVEIRVYP